MLGDTLNQYICSGIKDYIYVLELRRLKLKPTCISVALISPFQRNSIVSLLN